MGPKGINLRDKHLEFVTRTRRTLGDGRCARVSNLWVRYSAGAEPPAVA
jgi:hypothetical protein